MSFSSEFLKQAKTAVDGIDATSIEEAAHLLAQVRQTGHRLFICGSGGGAAHASHAVSDFRKQCEIEAYSPYDNAAEMTARINDDGWDSTITEWLKISKLSSKDCLLVISVGGGDREKNISTNLANAVIMAKKIGAIIIGIVGRDGGETAKNATVSIMVPNVDKHLVTPITESMQALVLHALAFHPLLQVRKGKWEAITNA